ncbi:flagellar hook-basal body protein [Anaerovorax odorimutans]|uniref:flagellar hook-basal body protein n=1 Tax=Anaerovorax odorimutans TaxID=109327 RepID=UPI00042695AA|nr:flagellar hook-basal body protein [Anaerovorax odorimutans]
MNLSFYSGSVGAGAQQSKLDTIANNIANVNTVGYKSENAGFVDLLYSNINAPETQDSDLKVGSGVRYEKTDIKFMDGGLISTDNPLDFAIKGDGFFAVMDPADGEIRYTRDGSFKMSLQEDGEFYLATAKGDLVLSVDEEPIMMTEDQKSIDLETIGIFDFENKEGFLCVGDNLYVPVDKNGESYLKEDSSAVEKYLELSNVDLASEMNKLIEAQKAYQMTLRMVKTSEEIEETINNLR